MRSSHSILIVEIRHLKCTALALARDYSAGYSPMLSNQVSIYG